MWFKQVQIFQLQTASAFNPEKVIEQLEPLAFISCLPSFPSSHGWVSPIDEANAPLIYKVNDYIMLCLQVEEKILPATVIRQELDQKIKEIQAARDRKVYQKEKYALKDEIIQTLLPRAFSKLSRTYAYIDTKNNWLILDTTNAGKTEKFLELLRKSLDDVNIHPIKTEKVAPILTRWLIQKDYPQAFSIEKSCVLIDANQQSRVIRCQQQNLFANSIEALIKDGCEVKQLALSWQEHINFILQDDFSLRSIKFQDEVIAQAQEMEPETKQQQFQVDFLIMTETLFALLKELIDLFSSSKQQERTVTIPKITTELEVA